jgi:hypothetical protein
MEKVVDRQRSVNESTETQIARPIPDINVSIGRSPANVLPPILIKGTPASDPYLSFGTLNNSFIGT